MESSRMHDVVLLLDQALGLLDHHLGDLHVAAWRARRRWSETTSPRTRALHVGDFLGALVDEQDDEVDLRVVRA